MLARLQSLRPWMRAALLVGAGGVLGWFQAPYNFWWLGLLAYPLLLLVIQPLRGWAAFRAGWLFGFGYFLFGLYWLSRALFVDITQFWWALPLALAGMPAICAVFTGLATWLTQYLAPRGLAQVLAFAVSLAGFEWVRGHIFTGFPWLLFGYSFVPGEQLAALLGAYGLNLVALLLVSLPAALPTSKRQALFATLLLIALGTGTLGWHHYWLGQPEGTGPTLHLRLVQPNVPQELKLGGKEREAILANLLELTATPSTDKIDAVIWPETAVPYRLAEEPLIRSRIAAALPEGSLLLTGAVRLEQRTRDDYSFYNSLLAMDGQGTVLGSYDKAHLVPFGEYIPFRQWLPFDPIAGGSEFTAGPGPRSLTFGKLPAVSPLICYEAIFPGAVATPDDPPVWLLNVTNDAWYGLTNGPHQHLRSVQMRAIEEGRVLVRVANNGITAVITPTGLIQSRLPLGMRGLLDSKITLAARRTPFVYWYGLPFGVLVFFTLSSLALVRRQQRGA
jgi:apolipoprotein N-acyltransferase